MRSAGTPGESCLCDRKVDLQGFEITVINANQRGIEFQRPLEFRRIVHLDQHVHAEFDRGGFELLRHRIVERRHDQEDAIGADRAGFEHLIGIEHEILAQDRQVDRGPSRREILVLALEVRLSVSTERQVAPPSR
jgi:hypothetical protein